MNKTTHMTDEQKTSLKKINTYTEEARNHPLIERGWICNHPGVKAVWFVGYLKQRANGQRSAEASMKLEILFDNMARHSIDAKEVAGMGDNIEELLAQKGDEYLRNGGTGTSLKYSDVNPE